MISEHYDAIKAMLPVGVAAYLGAAPVEDCEYPYAVLWGGLLDETDESLEDTPDVLEGWIKITIGGLGFESAAITMQRCRDALNRKAPVLAGRLVEPFRLEALLGIQADTGVVDSGTSMNLFYGVDEMHLVSHKL